MNESNSKSNTDSISESGENDELPERELASVTLTMGSGGPSNPLVMQPGAIVFEADPNSEQTPRTNWLNDLSESDFNRYLDALDALSKIHVTNLFSTVRQSALDFMAVVGEAYKALYENK